MKSTQTLERAAFTAEEMRVLAARAGRRHRNLTDSDDVFIAFALGQQRSGCSACAEYVDGDYGFDPVTEEPIDSPHVLRSHGIAIAVRVHDWVAFAARPAKPGQPCVGRVMAHAGRAAVFVHAVFCDEQVSSLDRGDFAQLCRFYGVERGS